MLEFTGFKTASASGLVALVDTPTVRDVQLEIGAVSETVDITSTAEAALNTSDASLGNSFERKRIVDLPLNANNVVGLLSLQPGVSRSGYVNGGRSDQSNITLDGVDVNEQQDGLDVVSDEAFASVLRVTRDSLQEFRVTTTNPNAEQGRSSGAQVPLPRLVQGQTSGTVRCLRRTVTQSRPPTTSSTTPPGFSAHSY